MIRDLGIELLGDSMLVFESAGVALLATMIGAVVLSSRSGRYGAADAGSLPPPLSRAATPGRRRARDESTQVATGHGGHHGSGTARRTTPERGAAMTLQTVLLRRRRADRHRRLRRAVAAVVRDADDGLRADAERRAARDASRSGRSAAGGAPKGQLLAIVVMAVMAVEMAIGFALVTAVYRKRQADTTEALTTLKH